MALVLCSGARAHAQSEDVVLVYEAFEGCPDRPRFEREVRALSQRANFVENAAGARSFRVTLERTARGVEGTLDIQAESGRSERKVSGKSCAEVASALALATAIAVDPTVLGGESAPAEKPPAEPEPAARPSAAPADRQTPKLDRGAQAEPTRPDRVVLGVGAGARSAIAPRATPSFALRLGWQPSARGLPLLFLEGAYALPVTTEFVEFSELITVRAGAAFALLDAAPWFAGPEIAFEAGNVKASANSATVSNPRVEAELWSASELGLFVRWHASSAFVVELAGGVVLPFVRKDYVYRPRSPVAEPVVAHSIPSVGGSGSLRLALFL
jgi:hypothetical protein